ncbi:MAG: sterol desaturase family protein, partial [Alphaproteobacteria bacterium]|nr:sterol desaturase family protein [Alphaproteobacteria bacterium]
RNDGQIGPDLAHTLLNKGVAQVIIAVVVFLGIADWLSPAGGGLWPTAWPIAAQTALGLVVAEAGLYWKHRLAHEWPVLWRFHAVHHSVTRLWFFNTGRFHLVDTVTGLAVGMPVLLALGAPREVLILVSAITAIIGLLTHCNVEMRCGWLSYVFNTPTLHRWHHSQEPQEGNRNYGENLMLFDLMFGTFLLPARRPPRDIGIRQPMPATFWGQLAAPFVSARM